MLHPTIPPVPQHPGSGRERRAGNLQVQMMYLMLPPSPWSSLALGPSQTPNSSYPAFQPGELLRKLHSRENFLFQMRLYKPSGSPVTVQWMGFLPCSWVTRLKVGTDPSELWIRSHCKIFRAVPSPVGLDWTSVLLSRHSVSGWVFRRAQSTR